MAKKRNKINLVKVMSKIVWIIIIALIMYSLLAIRMIPLISNAALIYAELSPQKMWEEDRRYSEYLSSDSELEYFLNAQAVSQIPYIESEKDNKLNGKIKFFRNNSNNEMKYAEPKAFQKYVDDYNKTGSAGSKKAALEHFTVSDTGVIKVAYYRKSEDTITSNDPDAIKEAANELGISNYSSKRAHKLEESIETVTISYVSFIQKYVLPFNLLWSIIVMGNSSGNATDLAHEIADLTYNGEMSLIIDDCTVISKTTDVYTYDLMEYYTGKFHATVKEKVEETVTGSQGATSTSTNTYTPNEKVLNNYKRKVGSFKTTKVHYEENNSPVIRIKKIDSWCAKYEDNSTYTPAKLPSKGDTTSTDLNDTAKTDAGRITVNEGFNIPLDPLVEWKKTIENQYKNHTVHNGQRLVRT